MEYVIEMNNITKVFPGIVANDDITLQVKQGEIHALLGKMVQEIHIDECTIWFVPTRTR